MLSERPEYNDKIKTGVLLAPTIFVRHSKSIWKMLSFFGKTLESNLRRTIGPEFLSYYPLLMKVLIKLCSTGKFIKPGLLPVDLEAQFNISNKAYCDIIFPFLGFSPFLFDRDRIPDYLGDFPAGTSLKNLDHFLQLFLYQHDDFRMYDYGLVENKKRYDSEIPPAFDLAQITSPTAVFGGVYDNIAMEVDVKTLVDKLPNVIKSEMLEYNHGDFMLGTNLREVLFGKIDRLIQ